MEYNKTVKYLDINKFMGDWHVIAGRFTFLEKGVHNGLENYSWNEKEQRIDIKFSYNKNSLQGKLVTMSQKAWVENKDTNAHWKVSPIWPLKLDYLVLDLADDYSWTAVGVPSGKYLWIMARDKKMDKKQLGFILERLGSKGYPIEGIVFVPHN
jgi:apolipoprotein D and lipocalin family protein